MKFNQKSPPRQFEVGNAVRFYMEDCGSIYLNPNEQVTFVTDDGAEYDVAKKDWGYYATPSLNGRLSQFGFRTFLIKNTITGRFFIFLVESGKEDPFNLYLRQESLAVVVELSDDEQLEALVKLSSQG